MGANAQVIIDLIPEVELIVGKQPSVPSLSAVEAQNRILQTFLGFIKVFARLEHPLVIFMDDMQWANTTNLALWQSIVTDAEMQHLLFVAAYRDNEVNPDHPLVQTIKKIRSLSNLTKITLKPLSVENTTYFVADTLNLLPKAVESLAELLHKKTQGNPFFLAQLLKSLYSDGLLQFDYQAGWQWDIEEIQKQNITDNVVELMIGKLQQLPESTQQALQLAACIGNEFDLQTLSVISANNPQQAMQSLSDALQQGLIIPLFPNQQTGEDALRNYEQPHPNQKSPTNPEPVRVGSPTNLTPHQQTI